MSEDTGLYGMKYWVSGYLNEFNESITGDFNLHLDKPDDSQVKQILSALDSTNLT